MSKRQKWKLKRFMDTWGGFVLFISLLFVPVMVLGLTKLFS